MSQSIDAPEIIRALSRAGYFDVLGFHPNLFTRVVERGLNIATPRALDILADSRLTTFEYTTDADVHPKDVLDCWRVRLTAAGVALLSEQPAGKLEGQTSNTSLERTRDDKVPSSFCGARAAQLNR
jgi:hypothetical protein